jgi:hypothetical protein
VLVIADGSNAIAKGRETKAVCAPLLSCSLLTLTRLDREEHPLVAPGLWERDYRFVFIDVSVVVLIRC